VPELIYLALFVKLKSLQHESLQTIISRQRGLLVSLYLCGI